MKGNPVNGGWRSLDEDIETSRPADAPFGHLLENPDRTDQTPTATQVCGIRDHMNGRD